MAVRALPYLPQTPIPPQPPPLFKYSQILDLRKGTSIMDTNMEEDKFTYALKSNDAWANYKGHQNPTYFPEMSKGQSPQIRMFSPHLPLLSLLQSDTNRNLYFPNSLVRLQRFPSPRDNPPRSPTRRRLHPPQHRQHPLPNRPQLPLRPRIRRRARKSKAHHSLRPHLLWWMRRCPLRWSNWRGSRRMAHASKSGQTSKRPGVEQYQG